MKTIEIESEVACPRIGAYLKLDICDLCVYFKGLHEGKDVICGYDA